MSDTEYKSVSEGWSDCIDGGRRRGVCFGAQAQVFSPIGSRAQTPLCHPAASYTITISRHHFLTYYTTSNTHTLPPLQETPTIRRSFDQSIIHLYHPTASLAKASTLLE